MPQSAMHSQAFMPPGVLIAKAAWAGGQQAAVTLEGLSLGSLSTAHLLFDLNRNTQFDEPEISNL